MIVSQNLSIRAEYSPKDGFQFTVCFYGPSTPLIEGRYSMPGVLRE